MKKPYNKTAIPAGWSPAEWAINLERISVITDFPNNDLSHFAEWARLIREKYSIPIPEKQDAR